MVCTIQAGVPTAVLVQSSASDDCAWSTFCMPHDSHHLAKHFRGCMPASRRQLGCTLLAHNCLWPAYTNIAGHFKSGSASKLHPEWKYQDASMDITQAFEVMECTTCWATQSPGASAACAAWHVKEISRQAGHFDLVVADFQAPFLDRLIWPSACR